MAAYVPSTLSELSGPLVGTVVVLQTGGTTGVDELRLSHDGTRATIEAMDGTIRLKPANVSTGTIEFTERGGGGPAIVATGASRLTVDAYLGPPGAAGGWGVDAAGNLLPTSTAYGLYASIRTVAAPADGTLIPGQAVLWLDATDGATKLMVKAKSADGTVRTGSITLT